MERPPAPPLVADNRILNPDELRALPTEKLFAMMDLIDEMTSTVEIALIQAGYVNYVYNMSEKQLLCRLHELATEKLLVREAIEFHIASDRILGTETLSSPARLSANGTTTSNVRAYVGHSRTSVPLDQVLSQQQKSTTYVDTNSLIRHRKSNVQKKLDFSL